MKVTLKPADRDLEEPDQYNELVERQDNHGMEQEQAEHEDNEHTAQDDETDKGKQKAVTKRLKKGKQIEPTRVSVKSGNAGRVVTIERHR